MPKQNEKLRAARQRKRWSQEKAAEAIRVDRKTYIRWENGQSHPQLEVLQRAEEVFGMTAEELGFLINETPLPPDPKGKLSTIANPFTYGNPISDPKHFVGREYEVERVFGRLCNAGFGSSSLVGERRIGKTSLLKHLAHPDVRKPYGLNSDKHLFVHVNLQIVQTTPEELWQWLLLQMASCCSDQQVKQLLEKPLQTQSINTYAFQLQVLPKTQGWMKEKRASAEGYPNPH